MSIELPPGSTTPNADDTAKRTRRHDVGGLLLLMGVGLVVTESSMDSSTIAGGLGFLLLIVGAGLILHRQPEDNPAH